MKTSFTIAFLVLILFFSCDTAPKTKKDKKIVSTIDSSHSDHSMRKDPIDKVLNNVLKDVKPIFGYRFVISGDFDGDGNKEQLIEHFFSGIDNKETNKYDDGLEDYAEEVALTVKKKPYSFVCSDNTWIDTLTIASGGQLSGLSYLKNEGDLNGDGTDEVSYVVNWADWSSTNTWHVVTYHNKKWTPLYSFPIWDWQLPDLPETSNQFGLFGLEQHMHHPTNDTLNNRLEKELLAFKGLVSKIKTNTIQVCYRNAEAEEDTMIVDLKRLK